jgi:hypothetical protein
MQQITFLQFFPWFIVAVIIIGLLIKDDKTKSK